MSTIYINTDGGARGNPGPAGIGIVFFDENENEIHKYNECIGEATNNQAEYRAIIKALEILKKSKWFSENNGDHAKVICRLDSQLVVEQINGNFKVKNDGIKSMIDQIRVLLSDFRADISFIHIPREKNKLADKLVNNVIDTELKNRS
jgi:ribonuclease HI